jgi:ABC-2 type transport system permease protein
MNAALTHIRREYWEHRGRFLWLPIVVFGLFMLLALIGGVAIGGGFTAIHPAGAATGGDVAKLGFWIGFVFYVIYGFSCIAYLVSCLSEDRTDKSVLFWRSLPVSDTATVLGKIGAFALLGTVVMLAASILTHLLVLLAFASAASARGAAGFSVYYSWTALVGTWALLGWAMLLTALWWLPYAGWLLLISSIFRKRTPIWSIWPLVAAGFLEEIITAIFSPTHTATSHVFHFLTRHLIAAPIYPWVHWSEWGVTSVTPDTSHGFAFLANAGEISNFLATPSMWIGFGIGAGLIIIAIIVRRYTATA